MELPPFLSVNHADDSERAVYRVALTATVRAKHAVKRELQTALASKQRELDESKKRVRSLQAEKSSAAGAHADLHDQNIDLLRKVSDLDALVAGLKVALTEKEAHVVQLLEEVRMLRMPYAIDDSERAVFRVGMTALMSSYVKTKQMLASKKGELDEAMQIIEELRAAPPAQGFVMRANTSPVMAAGDTTVPMVEYYFVMC
jgi:predicted nuclease with TOPRIM domain